MALSVRWSKIISFLKNPIRTFKQWRNRKKTLPDDEVTVTNNEIVEKNIEQITQNIEDEMSLTLLRNRIEVIEKTKSELTKKARNKYNNQLDQLLMRANARLRKLKELTFEELDLERLLIEQKMLLAKKVNNNVNIKPIDFARIRNHENVLANINFSATREQPRKAEIVIPKEAEDEVLVLLEELLIKVEPEDAFWDWQTNPETSIDIAGKEKSKLKIDENESSEIIDYFKKNGIVNFYHVTNYKNVESIESRGLFSWSKLDQLNVKYYNELTDGVSQSLDRRKGKQNYVRLSFCEATPMFHAKGALQTNLVYSISLDCLKECKFEFSNMNATDNNVSIGTSLKFVKENLRFDLFNQFYPHLDGMQRKYFQAEILIKEHIPAKYIISKKPL